MKRYKGNDWCACKTWYLGERMDMWTGRYTPVAQFFCSRHKIQSNSWADSYRKRAHGEYPYFDDYGLSGATRKDQKRRQLRVNNNFVLFI